MKQGRRRVRAGASSRSADALSPCPVPPGGHRIRLADVERFIDEVAVHSHHSVLLLLDANGELRSMVPPRQLAIGCGPDRQAVRVRGAATPLSQCTSAAPDALPPDAFERVRPAVGMRIPVADQRCRPAGIALGPISTGSAGSTHWAAT